MDWKISVIALSFGYAEEAILGSLICQNDELYFDNEKAAINHLAKELFAKYRGRFRERPALMHCCLINKSDPKNKYCCECGCLLTSSPVTSFEFQQWLCGLLVSSVDQYGYEHECEGVEMTWQIGMPADTVVAFAKEEVLFVEHADVRLAGALGLEDAF